MTTAAFFEDGIRLLTADAFEFVLDGEIKRAVRSQSFLTLVVFEATREWDGMTVTADAGMVDEVAQAVVPAIRTTDPIGDTRNGLLSLVLVNTDYESSTGVIERLIQRIDGYEFPSPLRVSVGAACYPTHADDAESLRRRAISHPIASSGHRALASKGASPHG